MTPHHQYTTIMNKEGWQLIIDFVEPEELHSTLYISRKDDWITEDELRPYHDAVRYISEVFGFPVVGDIIEACNSDLITVKERWFDFPKKVVRLCVE